MLVAGCPLLSGKLMQFRRTVAALLAVIRVLVWLSFIQHRSVGKRVALWSARAWAFNPYVWYWSIHWIWDTTFTPLMLALIFLVLLEMEQWPGYRGWVLFGALWGVGALANPAMLSFLPFCGLWIWWRRYKHGLPSLGGVVLSSLIFFLVLSPWLIRNYAIFGRF